MILALSLGLTGPTIAEDSLTSIFSADEYRRAGLDKLSPEEQAVLLRALQQRGLGDHGPTSPGKPALQPARAERSPAKTDAPPEKKGLWARIKDFGAEQLPLRSEKDEGEVTEIAAQMAEPFIGLNGSTRFHLDNGQVWEQRIAETYYIGKPILNPKVIILRTRFGYRLKIPAVGSGFDISVKRIQ